MILGFGNNVVSSLASDITSSQTSIPVFPGDGPLFAALLTSDFSNNSTELKKYAKITLTDSGETAFEICHLLSVSGDTLTVVRGQEGTAAKGWSLKDVVANFATRGSENAFTQIAHVQSGFYTAGNAGGTANALTLNLPSTFFLNGSADWVLKTPIVVYPTQNNTGAATLQLTMGDRVLGTFPLYKGNKAELVANDILKDVGLVCLMDNTKTFFNVANPGAIYAGLGTAAFRNVADNAPGDLVPVGYKGTYKSEANHGAIDFATYPFVVGESLFIDVRGCANIPPFLNQDYYYIEVICATNPAQGGRVNRPLVQFVSYTNSTMYLGIREDDGATINWRSFRVVQYDSDNTTLTTPGGIRAFNGATELAQNAIIIRGDGNKHLWFFRTDNQEAALIYAGNDNVLRLRGGGGPALAISPDGSVGAPGYLGAGDDIHSGRNISSVGIIQAGNGLYDTPGVRVYSPNNPPPQQDLSPYAPISWVSSNFLQGVRKGAKGSANSNQSSDRFARAPDGASVVSVYNENTYIAIEYRYDQYNVNGNWYNVGAI
ncbi:hypothetical protein N5C39_22810 [Enterobacter bugandensis]|uniref:Uncharacterized protein n=1 Tax=Enterobacter bugandensis TaxID=881260 RepID=A0AA42PV01_9ENTR|nr:hypothetical protein [Enterobacter bugandensis]MDH1321204.1 hypothetical protein [Enterobacter bugandensis]